VISSYGFMCMPAPTNRLAPRLNAVERFLTESRGGTAAMLLDKLRCPKLMGALNGSYRFKYNQIGESQPIPEKNQWSHVADAHQYLCQGASGGTAVAIARQVTRAQSMAARTGSAQRAVPSSAGWT
jgi:hypothetical protein